MLELVRISKHLGEIYKNLPAAKRYLAQHRRYLRRYQASVENAAVEFFNLISREIRSGISDITGTTAARMVDSLTDWDALEEEGRKIYAAPLHSIFIIGADRSRRNVLTKQDRTDPIGEEAVNWASAHSAELVTGITTQTMLAIRKVIQQGLDQGQAIQAIAKKIRAIVGLNERQAIAASNLLTRLEAAGLSGSAIDQTISQYINKAHRYRGLLIARTETAFSLNEGTRLGYAAMGIERLQRIEDPECCEICADYNGHIYTIAEAEGVLPEHPNCEGTWVMAP